MPWSRTLKPLWGYNSSKIGSKHKGLSQSPLGIKETHNQALCYGDRACVHAEDHSDRSTCVCEDPLSAFCSYLKPTSLTKTGGMAINALCFLVSHIEGTRLREGMEGVARDNQRSTAIRRKWKVGSRSWLTYDHPVFIVSVPQSACTRTHSCLSP